MLFWLRGRYNSNKFFRAMCDLIARIGLRSTVYPGLGERLESKFMTSLRAARGAWSKTYLLTEAFPMSRRPMVSKWFFQEPNPIFPRFPHPPSHCLTRLWSQIRRRRRLTWARTPNLSNCLPLQRSNRSYQLNRYLRYIQYFAPVFLRSSSEMVTGTRPLRRLFVSMPLLWTVQSNLRFLLPL